MKKEILIYSILASLVVVAMSVYAIGEREYGFYQLFRVAVFLSGVLTAYCAYLFKGYLITVLSVLFALLFNPIFVINLQKETWQAIDLITGTYFFIVTVVYVVELLKQDDHKKTQQ